jgi:hypothetical protein
VRLEDEGGSLRMTMPANRRSTARKSFLPVGAMCLALLAFWGGVWPDAFALLIGGAFQREVAPVILAVVVVGNAPFLLFSWYGREMVSLTADTMVTRRDLWGFGSSRTYPVGEVRNLRVASEATPFRWISFDRRSNLRLYGLAGGMLAFEFRGRTLRFGQGLTSEGADFVAARLLERCPSLGEQPLQC